MDSSPHIATWPEPIEALIDAFIEAVGHDFLDRPAEQGGPMKFGITLEKLSDWRVGRGLDPATVQDVHDLCYSEARRIYAAHYVIRPGFSAIDDEQLAFNVIDAGVLHGTAWATRRLQEAAGVEADGAFGPVTLAADNGGDPGRLNLLFAIRRVRKEVDIAVRNTRQLVWLRDWTVTRPHGWCHALV